MAKKTANKQRIRPSMTVKEFLYRNITQNEDEISLNIQLSAGGGGWDKINDIDEKNDFNIPERWLNMIITEFYIDFESKSITLLVMSQKDIEALEYYDLI